MLLYVFILKVSGIIRPPTHNSIGIMTKYPEQLGNKLKLVGNDSWEDAYYRKVIYTTKTRVEICQNCGQNFRIFSGEDDGF